MVSKRWGRRSARSQNRHLAEPLWMRENHLINFELQVWRLLFSITDLNSTSYPKVVVQSDRFCLKASEGDATTQLVKGYCISEVTMANIAPACQKALKDA